MNKKSVIDISYNSCLVNYRFYNKPGRYITKIFFNDWKNEINISNIIINIPRYHLYFDTILPQTLTNINKNTPEWHYINIIKNTYKNNLPKWEIYPSFLVKKNGINLKYLLINNKLDWLNTKYIFKILLRLLEITNILHNNKIAHLDINPKNITYDNSIKKFEDRFRLINFSSSDIYPFNYYRETGPSGTIPYCPILSINNYDHIPNKFPKDWTIINKKLYHRSENKKSYYNIYKHDVYSIGITMYFIFNLIYHKKYNNLSDAYKIIKNNPTNNEELDIILLNDILTKMTDRDILKRPTIEEILLMIKPKNKCIIL